MGLLKTAVSGMVWTTISTIVRSIVSLLQVSILTSYLTKADFGIVAICTLFIGFSQIFLDLGISVGILHKQNITKEQYSSLFWLNIICGVLITTILCCIAPIVSQSYKEPILTKLLILLSMTVLFSSIGAQHRTVQQKQMRFKYISIIEIISSLLTITLAVILVTNGYGIYSLVYSTMFNALFLNIIFLVVGLYKDRNISFHFKIEDTLPFLKIGIFSVGSEVLNYFSREFDVIIISATLGKETLGVYSLCKKLITAIYGAVNPILTKVLTPMLAKIQDDIVHVRKVYYDVIETLAFVNYPIYCMIAVFSLGILNFIYGQDYTEGRYVLGLLAIYYGRLATGNPLGALQTALGRTDTGFYWNIYRILFCAISVWSGSFICLEAVVIGLFFASLLSSPLAWSITIKPLIGGVFREYFFVTFKPFCIFVALAIPFYLLFSGVLNIAYMPLISLVYLFLCLIILCRWFKESYIMRTVTEKLINLRNI